MQKKKFLLMFLLVLILAFSFTGPVFAADTPVVVNFDDLSAYLKPVPADYAGLTWGPGWNSFQASGTTTYQAHSPSTSLISQSKTYIDFSPLGTDVIFDGAWFGGYSGTGDIYFEGWRDGALVATSETLTIDGSNCATSTYLAANFGQPVDKVFVCKTGTFCMDDLTYTIPGTTTAVDLDVTSTINLGANGVLPLSIFGSEDFDVTQIDPATIVIGSTGINENSDTLQFAFNDLNADGYLDAVFKVSIPELILNGDLDASTTELTVSGALLDGTAFEGTDTVTLVP